ncbi:AsmA family protein [Paraburkholderia kururiensis]|uniref:AsmA family protein n=1 Tax=Paraburkholderia kururiensis TaxID=984307 RepID=A0ABZ0WSF2_9BURK|nr:AsmA family protein [Paraburkholderia kururiensis]WQD80179.1 AsmA family protein [Paraburkholderia kururiensis]
MTPEQTPARTPGRRVGKIIAWLVALVAVLVAVVVVVFLTFDWNRARPWVDDKVSQAIGRTFRIEGDLKLGWRHPVGESGWRAWVPWPRFSAAHITVANPDWAKTRYFATLDEIDFEVELLPLLAHRIVVPVINLVNPSVDLERTQDDRNNWTFKLPSSSGPSTWKLDLHDITFAKGYIAYADRKTKADVQLTVDTLGQAVPIGDVMAAQESASRNASAQMVGKAGAARLAAQAKAIEASEAAAASEASAASGSRTATAAASSASGAAGSGSAVTASKASGSAAVRTNPVASTGSGASSSSAPSQPTTGPASAPLYAIGWTLKGTYNHAAVSGTGKLGGVLALQDANRPFPVQADMRAGDTHIALVGTITDPAHLAAVDLRLWLQGASMAHLYTLTGITLPETPPYATEGRLVGQFRRDGKVFRYENFTGRVGGSDLNGTLAWFQRQPRPLLQGQLVSNLLQFSDLAPIIGADTNASKRKRGDVATQPANRVIPVEEFRTDRWKAIDADVTLTGRRIVKNANLPITDLYTHVVLRDGALSLHPLRFGVAGGTLDSNIDLDGSGVPLKGRFATAARHLKLKQLFPGVKSMQSALGEINGDASLTATGNSPAALASTSNGEVKALVTQGTISLLLMEAAGLNVANVVYEKLFGTRDVKINCAAADFVATDGVLDSRVFALDTEDAVIDIGGKVNLHDESMDLNIHPHTKGFRVFSLRSPLYVKGTFKDPHVGVDAAALALRGGAMVGLGLINPFAALIPLIAPSNNKPLPCANLLAQMRQQPTAPPPGQKEKAPRLPSADKGMPASGAASR